MDEHRDPQTHEEWADAARGASGLLLIASAQAYGFVDGGPKIHVERCEEVIAGAAERGIVITSAEAQQAALAFVAAFAQEANAEGALSC